ncbi:MAG: trehalose-phosphatase [Candidatus Omnitrophica bacterium]|nr:trehalose-phosphatase [Candidatus Omnitrophota bacterium]
MKNFWSAWETFKGRIAAKPLMLFFDFDGTLSAFASRPQKAVLARETSNMLSALSKNGSCRIAIVSGRALADVKKKTGLAGLCYVGNHGLEIEGPELRHTINVGKDYRKRLKQIAPRLEAITSGFPGSFVEDKGLSLSVHYRGVDPRRARDLRTRLLALLLPYCVKNRVKIANGKMVLEVRPPKAWDKGKAVQWLIARWKALPGFRGAVPFYAGDDATDEDAFCALGNKGITVAVGKHYHSAAQYYLNTQAEVNELLRRLVKLRKPLP